MKDRTDTDRPLPISPVRGYVRLFIFLTFAVTMVWLGHSRGMRERFTPGSLESMVERLGVWGPLALAGIGFLLPFLMVPRWPVVFVAGALYGIWCGTALGVFSSGLGSTAHFLVMRRMLRHARLQKRPTMRTVSRMDSRRSFWLLFSLRAFPLTHCGLVNLLASALHMEIKPYLSATLLGMIPSSLLYAAWGKLMQRPHPAYYVLAVALTVSLAITAGLGIRRLRPVLQEISSPPASG
jgi:uncharacterized membrane protein YdjX (TVP38/TMEM64 family)